MHIVQSADMVETLGQIRSGIGNQPEFFEDFMNEMEAIRNAIEFIGDKFDDDQAYEIERLAEKVMLADLACPDGGMSPAECFDAAERFIDYRDLRRRAAEINKDREAGE